MTISREDFESRQKNKQIEIQSTKPEELLQQQATGQLELTATLEQQQKIQGKVVTTKFLEPFNIEDVKRRNADVYGKSARNVDLQAGERQARELSAEKKKDNIKVHRQINELMENCKSFEDAVKLNDTIRKIERRIDESGDRLPEAEARKLMILKDKTSFVYERYLRLDHVNKNTRAKKDELPGLNNAAEEELERSENEWAHVQAMAEALTGTDE